MPRVLQILNRLVIGGPSAIAVLLTKHLESEYETLLVTGEKDLQEQDANYLAKNLEITPHVIPEMRRSVNPFQDFIAYKKMKDIIKEFKPDIVHTHAAKSGAIGRLAAKACNVPVIIHTFHGHVFHSYFNTFKSSIIKQIERYLASKSSAIIAISDTQKHELSLTYKIAKPENITVIPLGVDLEKFQVNKGHKREKFRSFYELHPEEIAIGIVGRIVPVKNHMMFLRIIKLILNSVKEHRVRFFIVGDGNIRDELAEYLIQNNIDFTYYPNESRRAVVTFTSWIEEMDIVYAGLDIVTLTSLNEGTPVTLIEAQAAEKPIISTNVGGVKDVVQENVSGFTTAVNDDEHFAYYVKQLLLNKEMRLTMGKAGRNHVFSKYSYRQLIDNTRALYNTLLNHSM